MRLVAGDTAQLGLDLARIGRIEQVRNRMSGYRMPAPVLKRKDPGLVLLEIVFRQLDLAVEDRDQMLRLQLLRLRLVAMAFEAERVGVFRPQKVDVVAAMRFVADRAALAKRRLMQLRLLELLSLFAMAGKAGIHRIRLQEARRPSGVRIVAGNAFSLCARMLHLRLRDLPCPLA